MEWETRRATFGIRVTRDLARKLEDEARWTGKTKSSLCEEAVRAYYTDEAIERRRGKAALAPEPLFTP